MSPCGPERGKQPAPSCKIDTFRMLGNRTVELNAIQSNHIASTQMDKTLIFTALIDFMMMIPTTTAKAAMITGLMVPPTEIIAKRNLHGPSVREKWRTLVTMLLVSSSMRTPKPAVKLAMRMLASTKRITSGRVLAAATRAKTTRIKTNTAR